MQGQKTADRYTICRHPALVQAFGAVAECKANVSGTVKVTAYEHMEVLDRSGDQSKVDMLLFPAGQDLGSCMALLYFLLVCCQP